MENTPRIALMGGREAVDKVRSYIQDRYSESISLDQLSAVAGLSKFHLLRTFKKAVGLAPHEFLVHVRVARARELLRRGTPIAIVAVETGFTDQSHLGKHFKRLVGTTPSLYQNS